MSGSLRAMLWELWRTNRWDLAGRLGYSMAIMLFFIESMKRTGKADLIETARGVVVLVSAISSTFSMTWLRELESESTGFSYRLGFTRPVSTFQLVAVPMLCATLMSLVCFAVPAIMFRTMSGVPIPIMAPMLCTACACTWLTAATWSPTAILDKLVAMLCVFAVAVFLLARYHAGRDYGEPFMLAIGRPDYFQLGWRHYAVLLATTLATVYAAVVAVGWQRRGDGLAISKTIGEFFAGLFVGGSVRKPFRNRMMAQFSYEFRRCGPPVLLLGAAAPVMLWLFGRLLTWMYPEAAARADSVWQGEPIFWVLGLLFSPLLYQLLGAHSAVGLRKVEGVYRYSAYDATRPMSNGQLIAVKLVVVAVCSIVAWSFMWIGALLFVKFGGDGQLGPRVSAAMVQVVGGVPTYWWLAAICSLTMTYISMTSIMLAFGLWMPLYPRVFVGLCVFAYAHFGVAVYDKEHGWRGAHLWTAYAYVVASLIATVCLFAVWKAVRDRAISKQTLAALVVLWLVHLATSIALAVKSPQLNDVPAPLAAILCAMLLVPMAATTCAPLALGSQRHQR